MGLRKMIIVGRSGNPPSSPWIPVKAKPGGVGNSSHWIGSIMIVKITTAVTNEINFDLLIGIMFFDDLKVILRLLLIIFKLASLNLEKREKK